MYAQTLEMLCIGLLKNQAVLPEAFPGTGKLPELLVASAEFDGLASQVRRTRQQEVVVKMLSYRVLPGLRGEQAVCQNHRSRHAKFLHLRHSYLAKTLYVPYGGIAVFGQKAIWLGSPFLAKAPEAAATTELGSLPAPTARLAYGLRPAARYGGNSGFSTGRTHLYLYADFPIKKKMQTEHAQENLEPVFTQPMCLQLRF